MNSIQKQIVIVGAGPSGVGAALRLENAGFKDILLLDRFEEVGGIPRKYIHHGKPTFVTWSKGHILHGPDYADLLVKKLAKTGIETRLETTVLRFSPDEKELQVVSAKDGSYKIRAEVILFACGARERTSAERGVLTGHRPARVYHTLHLMELMKPPPHMPAANYALLGSEVIAYSLAEKLKQSGNATVIIDHEKSAACSFVSRFYFFRRHRPLRIPSIREIIIQGQKGLEKISFENKVPKSIPADYLILTGNLIPNTELLATANIPFRADSRQILPETLKEQQNQGIFITGNMQGTAFGGERAYISGYHTAGRVASYLK